ncbi:hypothetical protein QEG98_26320 [Myxococcus sp. MxC21-1]|uniref:hypothetical protein n=1 Tax=Myxococcus sp. MxC21-1 TaxID=3041439 RepID=UPI00292E2C9D|nr:hypothetical protein [Myxococcus sp. MxC21-1]WNZ59558.1 hypothetical protein QEG98_26320 [Myxococcus sp. MxC21-1]
MTAPSDADTSAESAAGLAEKAEELVSLAAELAHVGDAVNAAAILSECVSQDLLPSEEAQTQAPTAITAVLGLVHARLLQVRRVLRGTEDPAAIRTSRSARGEPQLGDDPDVVLRPWTPAQRAAHHARQQEKAERDEEAESPSAPPQEG